MASRQTNRNTGLLPCGTEGGRWVMRNKLLEGTSLLVDVTTVELLKQVAGMTEVCDVHVYIYDLL